MKLVNKIFLSALLLGVVHSANAQITVGVSSSQTEGGLGLNSDNTSWSTSGGFYFEIGVFNSSFIPSSGNQSEWSAGWTKASNGNNAGSSTWIDDGGATYFQFSGAYVNNISPFTVGAQLYIWGFDSKAVAGAEWILITNASWVVQAAGNPGTLFFDTTDVGTYAVFGSILNGGVDLKSGQVFAVPEPSAYVLIAAIAVFGFATVRRKRVG